MKNVDQYHPHLNDIIGKESTNCGVPYDEKQYGGLPWADGMKFIVLPAQKITECGEIGVHGRSAAPARKISKES